MSRRRSRMVDINDPRSLALLNRKFSPYLAPSAEDDLEIDAVPYYQKRSITTLDPESLGALVDPANPLTTTNWPAANMGLLVPVSIRQQVTGRGFVWQNGNNAAGHVDVALYDENFQIVPGVHTGSISQTLGGVNNPQSVALPPVVIEPGRYYLALALDSGANGVVKISSTIATSTVLWMWGCKEYTGYPFPDTITSPGAYIRTFWPLIALDISPGISGIF